MIPAVEQLVSLGGGSPNQASDEALNALKTLVSVEMLTVLQLVGFNFKRAIGEPLTSLVASLIGSARKADPDPQVTRLELEREIRFIEAAQDPGVWERLNR